MSHKSHGQLTKELNEAKQKVALGGVYAHYKHPDDTYRVTGFGFIESTDEVAVIYQSVREPELVFVRPLASWLEMAENDSGSVPRFSRTGLE